MKLDSEVCYINKSFLMTGVSHLGINGFSPFYVSKLWKFKDHGKDKKISVETLSHEFLFSKYFYSAFLHFSIALYRDKIKIRKSRSYSKVETLCASLTWCGLFPSAKLPGSLENLGLTERCYIAQRKFGYFFATHDTILWLSEAISL